MSTINPNQIATKAAEKVLEQFTDGAKGIEEVLEKPYPGADEIVDTVQAVVAEAVMNTGETLSQAQIDEIAELVSDRLELHSNHLYGAEQYHYGVKGAGSQFAAQRSQVIENAMKNLMKNLAGMIRTEADPAELLGIQSPSSSPSSKMDAGAAFLAKAIFFKAVDARFGQEDVLVSPVGQLQGDLLDGTTFEGDAELIGSLVNRESPELLQAIERHMTRDSPLAQDNLKIEYGTVRASEYEIEYFGADPTPGVVIRIRKEAP